MVCRTARMELIQILLIEDNPADARLLREMLREVTTSTFAVTQAERLADGLNHLKQGRFDIVLTDLSLPDSEGLEAFQ